MTTKIRPKLLRSLEKRLTQNMMKYADGQSGRVHVKNLYQFDIGLRRSMDDSKLEAIRRKRYLELQKKLATKQNRTQTTDPDGILNLIFKGRAWEVFNTANSQFPQIMSKIKQLLVKLASSGEVKEVTGEELYLFLVDLGLKVKLETKIEFASHGEVKSLQDRLKEELRKT